MHNLNELTKIANIIKELSRAYWGKEGSGAILLSKKTGNFLFGLRSEYVNEPGTWSGFGGKIDYGEDPEKSALREIEEETGYNGSIKLEPLNIYKDGNFSYYNYIGIVDDEFSPRLNWENDTFDWVSFNQWPNPLHFGTKYALNHSPDKLKEIYKKYVSITKTESFKTNNLISEYGISHPPPPIIHYEPAPNYPNIVNIQQLKDSYIIAATLWGEARGDGVKGMQAVMNVIMNRADGDFNKALSVVLKPKQFSVWNSIKNPLNFSLKLAEKQRESKTQDSKEYKNAIEIVDKARKGQLDDLTDGATFYFNPKKVTPTWAKKLKFIKNIGHHAFYKLPPKKKK